LANGPQTWTTSALAVEFQKKASTIAKRLEGIEPDIIRGKRKFWYMRNAAPAILGQTSLDPTQQRAALENARTRKLELEISRLEGDSIDKHTVRAGVAEMIGRARARLLAVPGAQAGRANPEDPKRAEVAFREGIYEALGELADAALARGAEVETASGPNGNGVGKHLPDLKSGVELGAWEVED
jgi:hypothetical protein